MDVLAQSLEESKKRRASGNGRSPSNDKPEKKPTAGAPQEIGRLA